MKKKNINIDNALIDKITVDQSQALKGGQQVPTQTIKLPQPVVEVKFTVRF